jgi:predicted aspartyl protease
MGSSFTRHLPYLRENGPVFEIILKPSDPTIEELKLEKKDIPFIKVLGLIDTGASTTAVSQRVVKKLKLVARGKAKVYTSSQIPELRNEYDISLEFDVDAYIRLLRVLEANLQDHSIDCLIGRDLLQYGSFIYNGFEKKITLSF